VSTDVYSTAPTVGDGTTARSRAAGRWRAARWPLLVLAALALVVAVLAVSRPTTSTTPFAPDNPQEDGARAVAEVLEARGVEVEHVVLTADAVRAAGQGTTLLVTPSMFLLPEQEQAIAETAADLVLVGAQGSLIDVTTSEAVGRVPAPGTPTSPIAPRCDLPAARAAGALLLTPGLTAFRPEVTMCWGDGEQGALAQVDAGGRTVTVVDDPSFLLNGSVLDEGNAALALHLLGANDRLVWFVPDPFDATTTGQTTPSAMSLLPSWAGVVGLWALLVALVAVLWRGRRFGRLVTEDLPVVVRAAETTRGRGRLYRRSRSRGHAAAGLRAATADRVARKLGLPRSADAAAMTDAVARATGRPALEVADLLYGPQPVDDAALTELARRLDIMESEVYRK